MTVFRGGGKNKKCRRSKKHEKKRKNRLGKQKINGKEKRKIKGWEKGVKNQVRSKQQHNEGENLHDFDQKESQQGLLSVETKQFWKWRQGMGGASR